MEIDIAIPAILTDHVEVSSIYRNYNASGNPSSYGVDIELEELGLDRSIKSREFHLLGGKIESTLKTWAGKFERHLQKEHLKARSDSVGEMNTDAKEALSALDGILAATLDVDDAVDWATLKRKDSFRRRREDYDEASGEIAAIGFNNYGRPTGFTPAERPDQPTLEGVTGEFGFFSRLFLKRKITERFEARLNDWRSQVASCDSTDSERSKLHDRLVQDFETRKAAFELEKEADNKAVDELRERYEHADNSAIEDYCDLVLSNSTYPDSFPQSWELEYRAASKMLVVDYDLISPDEMPTVDSYRYVKANDEIVAKEISKAAHKKLYSSVIYQICIRTLHELFEADVVSAIDSVAFNGIVTCVNPATGIEESKAILSISASKDEFLAFDLARVDPKATFKHLKGVAAASLIDLTAIPPVVVLEKNDKRFIEGREIADSVDSSVNLAAMSWDDFEHLVRELFEREFASNGGEVRVTQASSDGGVDAIAFDPDPIRGGKIVIQAKRYTNTVGVAAVRDLYGTVMNEGATKGILVTTADYGKDSYEFAKEKPITLLNGSNLLALLEKHGTKARINIGEAKKVLKG